MSKVEHRKLELVLNPKQLSASYQVLLMSPNCRFRITLSKFLKVKTRNSVLGLLRWKISHDKEQQISQSSGKIEQRAFWMNLSFSSAMTLISTNVDV